MAKLQAADRSAEGRRADPPPRLIGVPSLWARRQPARIDTLLAAAQRFLIIFALLVGGHWLLDGPVRDWLHDRAALVAGLSSNESLNASVADPFARTTAGFALAPTVAIPRSEADLAALPARLRVPSIAINSAVKEVFVIDDQWQVADYAAGYLHGTGKPGSPGNVVIAGHAGLRGGVFRDLGSLAVGADVFVDAGGWRYQYRVRESRAVAPTELEVLDPTATPTLTLLTCTSWDTQRLIVIADLIAAQSLRGG